MSLVRNSDLRRHSPWQAFSRLFGSNRRLQSLAHSKIIGSSFSSWKTGNILLPSSVSHVGSRWFSSQEAYSGEISVHDNGLRLQFSDTDASFYHSQWLWVNDPSFIHSSSGQHTRSTTSFYQGWKIVSAKVITEASALTSDSVTVPVPPPPIGCFHPLGTVYSVDNYDQHSGKLLCVEWEGPEKKTSFYDLDWLKRCRYDEDTISKRRHSSALHSEHVIHSETTLRTAEYSDLASDGEQEDERLSFLSSIVDDGAAIVQNTPLAEESCATIARSLVGGVSHGHLYGDIFHVQAMAGSQNIAYTSVFLEPHQDLAYYESPPGLQLLHSTENSTQGGESILIDALAAAAEFRRVCPDLFEVLIRNEATFVKQRPGADMMYRRSHIRVDSNGDVVSVHWSPPFEGPLAICSENVDSYYLARCAFECMLDNSLATKSRLLPELEASTEEALKEYAATHTYEYRLQPGEMLVFNNQRLLHGRRAFQFVEGSKRHLIGCYANIDEMLNQYRMLCRMRRSGSKEDPLTAHRSIGNGSSYVL